MTAPRDFSLTKHAIARMLERFPRLKESWDARKQPGVRLKFMYELFWEAEELKSVVNDTEFMTYISNRYGAENKYTFFMLNDAVFIGVTNERGNHIVTVVRKCLFRSPQLRNS